MTLVCIMPQCKIGLRKGKRRGLVSCNSISSNRENIPIKGVSKLCISYCNFPLHSPVDFTAALKFVESSVLCLTVHRLSKMCVAAYLLEKPFSDPNYLMFTSHMLTVSVPLPFYLELMYVRVWCVHLSFVFKIGGSSFKR